MEGVRKPFQGVCNIVRFNWHFYLMFPVLILLFYYTNKINNTLYISLSVLYFAGSITALSLVISCYIYDFSVLYKLPWLPKEDSCHQKIINIHAGFDESSALIKNKFSASELVVLDFYDPSKHTEVSIKRARNAYPPYKGTLKTKTNHLDLNDNCADKIFNMLSAHEIRNEAERVIFFKELKRVIKKTGKIFVTEHLRDSANFFAYNIGFLHFHSRKAWIRTFASAGLQVEKEIKTTPFITTFILSKNGIAS